MIFLQKMRTRPIDGAMFDPVMRNDEVLVFKVQYGLHMKALQIKKECNRLYIQC